MALSNLGRNRRRSAFIIISLLLCIVLFNSIIIVTQSLDEEKWVNRVTRTDFNVYNSAAFNVMESVQHLSLIHILLSFWRTSQQAIWTV